MRRDDWLLAQLPVGMAEEDFTRRFLQIFQSVSNTVLHQIDVLDRAFDPTVAPDSMVLQLGRWVGLDWLDSSLDSSLKRRAVIEYSKILRWRGTRRGLTSLLQLLSDDDQVVVDDTGGVWAEGESTAAPPHVRLEMRGSSWAAPSDVVSIVRAEVPASVTFELRIDDRLVWPVDRASGGEQRVNEEVH